MGHALAQVVFQGDSNLPEDRYVNTFHFETDLAVLTTLYAIEIADRLVDFYLQDNNGAATALSNHMSSILAAGPAHRIKVYDQGLPQPRLPLFEQPFTLEGNGQPMPSEVSLCLSFQGLQVSGEPQARKRGRIFWGPLSQNMLTATDGRPLPPVVGFLADAGLELMTRNTANVVWSVFSPTSQLLHDVVDGWVDNAFDTQRRRGEASLSRTLF